MKSEIYLGKIKQKNRKKVIQKVVIFNISFKMSVTRF